MEKFIVAYRYNGVKFKTYPAYTKIEARNKCSLEFKGCEILDVVKKLDSYVTPVYPQYY